MKLRLQALQHPWRQVLGLFQEMKDKEVTPEEKHEAWWSLKRLRNEMPAASGKAIAAGIVSAVGTAVALLWRESRDWLWNTVRDYPWQTACLLLTAVITACCWRWFSWKIIAKNSRFLAERLKKQLDVKEGELQRLGSALNSLEPIVEHQQWWDEQRKRYTLYQAGGGVFVRRLGNAWGSAGEHRPFMCPHCFEAKQQLRYLNRVPKEPRREGGVFLVTIMCPDCKTEYEVGYSEFLSQ